MTRKTSKRAMPFRKIIMFSSFLLASLAVFLLSNATSAQQSLKCVQIGGSPLDNSSSQIFVRAGYPAYVNITSASAFVNISSPSGRAIEAASTSGDGIMGYTTAAGKSAVYGLASNPNAYSGFFEGGKGLVVNSGSVGIGTTGPGAKLDVAGNIKIADGTQGAGKVLTSDASGLASWQAVSSGVSQQTIPAPISNTGWANEPYIRDADTSTYADASNGATVTYDLGSVKGLVVVRYTAAVQVQCSGCYKVNVGAGANLDYSDDGSTWYPASNVISCAGQNSCGTSGSVTNGLYLARYLRFTGSWYTISGGTDYARIYDAKIYY